MKSNGKLCPLGKLVVKALTDQDKTKTQLAAEIGTSPQYLSYILYGVRSGEKYLPAIIAALNLDPRKVEKVTAAYQNIILEALTQPGDLFYDASFGWGLYDFIQSEDDDLMRLEIAQRAQLGLQKREVIVPESIEIDVGFSDDTFRLRCSFRFVDEEEPRELNVVISAVGVEVITT